MSRPPTYPSTKETTNYARLCRLLVDVGSDVLRVTFDRKRPPGSLDIVLSSPPTHAVLKSLKKKVLNPLQWGKLYPAIKSSVSSKNFDITLLMVLLRNLCGLGPPATGWNNLPSAADTTLEADIVRIKCFRNTVYGHASEASVDDTTFSQYWKDIQDALVRLGGASYQGAIDDLKNETMDPDFEKHYQELLKQWVKDEVSIKERLDDIEGKLDDLKESIVNPEKKIGVEAVNAYTSALKASIKSQTEFQTKLMASSAISSVKTDQIFTNILIQHGRKPVDGLGIERKERLRQYGKVSGTRVEHCQEIFIPRNEREKNPESILLTGKAGIGKSLFCQKLIRDWADDKLFQPQNNAQIPNFKFAYLLTFRQLNLLGDDRVTLREILNCSSVLDDHSNIDDSLFEYIVNHSEEVLIVIDGYDEYSKPDYIPADLDEQYPNNAQEKMPVAALCAKLIKRKILRGSVVMVTSRPDESDKMKEIRFDRYVEITGFSEQQVKEYIEKYFRENENMKNIVLDHITKNDDLVSFAHIPVLCFLMCCYIEYILNESMSTDDLPVKTTDLYFEVVNRFVLDHNKKEIPSEETLKKLSKLAAQLLLEKKFVFVEEDMKEFHLNEVESLRASGLLHCGPPFRKSFSETTKHFCFTHLTVQEYLAALWFVNRREIPSVRSVSSMVMQFMAGILSKKKDNEFMEELLEKFQPSHMSEGILLTGKCLSEYQDRVFAKHIIKKRYRQFTDHDGNIIEFRNLTDVDCIAVSFLLDVISALNEEETDTKHQPLSEQPFVVERLEITDSDLTRSGVRRICNSLEKDHCQVTELQLDSCHLNYECAQCIEGLLSSKLTELTLSDNQITDTGVVSLCQALQTSSCKVTTLVLSSNQITDDSVVSLCQALQTSSCKVTTLDLSHTQITDAGVVSLCQPLQTSSCKVTTLDLSGNQITDAGVSSLCQALQTSTCKVTSLDLGETEITDASAVSLCQALQTSTCRVTTLYLIDNQITDVGAKSLCQALQTSSCKVTTLYLSYNQITNTGVLSLCQALQTSSCKVNTLYLSYNQITDSGVVSLCKALQSSFCKVTTLDMSGNQITDAGVSRLCQTLQTSNCKVTTLALGEIQITDTGVVSLCQALQTSSCKITSLNLGYNQITDVGVFSLCQALQLTTCKVTTLELDRNQITDAGKNCLRNLQLEKPDIYIRY